MLSAGRSLYPNGIASIGLRIKLPQPEKGNSSKVEKFVAILSTTSIIQTTTNKSIEIIPFLNTKVMKYAKDNKQKHFMK